MLTIKPLALGCATHPVAGAGGVTNLIIAVSAGFEMQGVRPVLCWDQRLWKTLAGVIPPATAPDLGQAKVRSEWLAFGEVYPASAEAVSAYAQVMFSRRGEVLSSKRLHVSGARHWRSLAGAAWPSEPAPLGGPTLLEWSRAYGGGQHRLNPGGVGFYEGRWADQPLPQIEYANALMTSPDDRPLPAGFGPLPLDGPDRWLPSGTYDQRWRENDFPAMAADTPADVLMLAPRDQQIEGYFQPGDILRCEGMTETGQPRQWELPPWQARAFIRRPVSGYHLVSVTMHADTVWLLPQEGLLGLVWRGSVPITENDAFDVDVVMAALEDIDDPRPLSLYEAQVAARSGTQQNALLASLDESPLLPRGQGGSLIPAMPPDALARINKIQAAALATAKRAQALGGRYGG